MGLARAVFLASALLVLTGLWVRLSITETPDFQKTLDRKTRVTLPLGTVVLQHGPALVIGTLGAFATFVLFYLMTVFALGYGTKTLGYDKEQFLLLQMAGIVFFCAGHSALGQVWRPPWRAAGDAAGQHCHRCLWPGICATVSG